MFLYFSCFHGLYRCQNMAFLWEEQLVRKSQTSAQKKENFQGLLCFLNLFQKVPGKNYFFSETLHCILCNKTIIWTVADRFLAEFGKNTSNFGKEWLFPGLASQWISSQTEKNWTYIFFHNFFFNIYLGCVFLFNISKILI